MYFISPCYHFIKEHYRSKKGDGGIWWEHDGSHSFDGSNSSVDITLRGTCKMNVNNYTLEQDSAHGYENRT